ncbi:MAG: ParB/RepB/Spo0J family partition protein [Planctomycetes bacterium]|nr:ParB/RepB/Spo0J family partition protein [Planctomycetota bacterium]MBI3833387.1 ParB/RepB/Spo0J family partition protein [Planctomycetota bacterium]
MPRTQRRKKEKAATKDRIQMLPVDKIIPTPDNRRRGISDTSLRSLSHSIKKDGLLQPIVVRVHATEPGHWEIRAGERRWRAAKLAGLTAIPAIVRRLDDEEALSVTIAENIQRRNLHPLEEAETIQLAFERDFDLNTIAAKLGKSIPYLARRASLTRLTPAWKSEIRKPDSEVSRFSAAHLELIARLPEPTQTALSEDNFMAVFGRGFPTVDELRRIIDDGLRSLGAMPWDPKDETIVPKAGACLNCEKRSSKQPMLFAEAESAGNGKLSKNDRCLDPQCFDRKHVAFVQRCECALRAEHPTLRLVHLGVGSLSSAVSEVFGNRLDRLYGAKPVKPHKPGSEPAMQVDGPKAGKLIYVASEDSTVSHNGSGKGRPRDEGGNVVPMTLIERRARLQKRRDAYVVKHVQTYLRELTPEKAQEIVSPWIQRRNNKAEGTVVFDLVALLVTFGAMHRADFLDNGEAWTQYDSLRNSASGEPAAAALFAVAQVWIKRLNAITNEQAPAQATDAKRMCEILGVDYATIEADAKNAIPEPKSWASLRDDASTTDRPHPETADMEPPLVEDEEEVSTAAASIG